MGAVRTVDQVLIRAPVPRVFQFAGEIERWPHILPHYRWVRFLDRRDGGGPAEMAAWRPIGTAADGLWQGLTARRSAVREITRFDPAPFRSRIAAEIPDFRPQDHLNAKRAKRLDRFSQLAVASARLALADAELDPGREDADRVGSMMGSALGGVAFAEAQVGSFLTRGPRGLDPALALAVFPGAASCNIAIEFGFTGPNSTNAMSCASGTIAVGDAFQAIREARADVMLAGGAEAPLAPMTYGAFSVIRAMSTRNDDPAHASRPFDEARDGFVMGEGAADHAERPVGHGRE